MLHLLVDSAPSFNNIREAALSIAEYEHHKEILYLCRSKAYNYD